MEGYFSSFLTFLPNRQENDWEEMLENSNPLIKKLALSLIRKRNYDNDQINRFYMRNIQDRKNDYTAVYTGINREINKNKINKHLAETNLGKNIKGKEWDTISQLYRSNRIKENFFFLLLICSKSSDYIKRQVS